MPELEVDLQHYIEQKRDYLARQAEKNRKKGRPVWYSSRPYCKAIRYHEQKIQRVRRQIRRRVYERAVNAGP